jgi:hypothetical protein
MNNKRLSSLLLNLFLVALVLGSCGTPQPAATPASRTATTVPIITVIPTDTAAPTITPTPVEQVNLGPSPRGELQMAYSPKTDQIVIFGGAIANPNLPNGMSGETWMYDVPTNTWTEIKSPSAPSPRDNAGLVYDIESDRFILFGGAKLGDFCLKDTWSLDLSTKIWTQMKSKPKASCLGTTIVYNSKADRILVFGGQDFREGVARNETWAYDYNTDTWTDLKPAVSPPGHIFASMAYDTKADRVIMWGGWGTLTDEVCTWIYDYNTNTWEKRETDKSPGKRTFHTLTYDPKADRTMLYGGYKGGPAGAVNYPRYNSDETWAYDYSLNTWARLEPVQNPGLLSFVGQVYVPSISRVLLYGGNIDMDKHSDKIWLFDFDTNTWTEVLQDL